MTCVKFQNHFARPNNNIFCVGLPKFHSHFVLARYKKNSKSKFLNRLTIEIRRFSFRGQISKINILPS